MAPSAPKDAAPAWSVFKPSSWKQGRKVKVAHLPSEEDDNKMYYNAELKRWVERGKEEETSQDPSNAPPPVFTAPVPLKTVPSRKTLGQKYVAQPNLSVSSSTNSLSDAASLTPSASGILPLPPPPNGHAPKFFVPTVSSSTSLYGKQTEEHTQEQTQLSTTLQTLSTSINAPRIEGEQVKSLAYEAKDDVLLSNQQLNHEVTADKTASDNLKAYNHVLAPLEVEVVNTAGGMQETTLNAAEGPHVDAAAMPYEPQPSIHHIQHGMKGYEVHASSNLTDAGMYSMPDMGAMPGIDSSLPEAPSTMLQHDTFALPSMHQQLHDTVELPSMHQQLHDTVELPSMHQQEWGSSHKSSEAHAHNASVAVHRAPGTEPFFDVSEHESLSLSMWAAQDTGYHAAAPMQATETYQYTAAADVSQQEHPEQASLPHQLKSAAHGLKSKGKDLLGALAGFVNQGIQEGSADFDMDEEDMFDSAMHPSDATKLDGPLPWELPDHLLYSDQFLSICTTWQRNNPGKRYTPDLLMPAAVQQEAPAADTATTAAQTLDQDCTASSEAHSQSHASGRITASLTTLLTSELSHKAELSHQYVSSQGVHTATDEAMPCAGTTTFSDNCLVTQQTLPDVYSYSAEHGSNVIGADHHVLHSHLDSQLGTLVDVETSAVGGWVVGQDVLQDAGAGFECAADVTCHEAPPPVVLSPQMDYDQAPPPVVLSPQMDYDQAVPAVVLSLQQDYDQAAPAVVLTPLEDYDQAVPAVVLTPLEDYDQAVPAVVLSLQMDYDQAVPPVVLSPQQDYDQAVPAVVLSPQMDYDQAVPAVVLSPQMDYDQAVPAVVLSPQESEPPSELSPQEESSFITQNQWPTLEADHGLVTSEAGPSQLQTITDQQPQQENFPGWQVQRQMFSHVDESSAHARKDSSTAFFESLAQDTPEQYDDSFHLGYPPIQMQAVDQNDYNVASAEVQAVHASAEAQVSSNITELGADMHADDNHHQELKEAASSSASSGTAYADMQHTDGAPAVEQQEEEALPLDPAAQAAQVSEYLHQVLYSVRTQQAVPDSTLDYAMSLVRALQGRAGGGAATASEQQQEPGTADPVAVQAEEAAAPVYQQVDHQVLGSTPSKLAHIFGLEAVSSSLNTPQRYSLTSPYLVNPSPSSDASFFQVGSIMLTDYPAHQLVDGSSLTPNWPSTPADDILALQQQCHSGSGEGLSSQLAALKRELKEEYDQQLAIKVQELEEQYQLRLKEVRAELEAEYERRLAEKDAELAELRRKCEETQDDLDQLLLCLGQESRKVTDLAQAMIDAGLDPEEITRPIEEEYAAMDLP